MLLEENVTSSNNLPALSWIILMLSAFFAALMASVAMAADSRMQATTNHTINPSEFAATSKPESQPKTLHLGVYNFPPDFFASPDNKQCGGLAFDQLKNQLQGLGYHLKAVCIPPARLYKELADGNVDMIVNIKSTKALPEHLRVIEPPFSLLEATLYQHKSRSQAPNDLSIAAIRAFDYQGKRAELIRQQFEFVDMPDATAAIDLFLHERTRYLLTYDGPFQARLAQIRQLPFQTLSPYVAAELNAKQPFKRRSMLHIPTYVMISTLHPEAATIARALEQFAQQQRCNTLKNCPPQTRQAKPPQNEK
jgi:hypothetical protein